MKVRIYKPHTHADVRHVPGPDGIEIDVSEQDKAFLDRAGITARPLAARVAAAVPEPAGEDPSLIEPKPAKR